ncbi:MAG: hypothetical protein IKR76_11885 [Ruminococcus sp.]|nr:hypothetical protein [Ruminococcus sp.]
MSKALYVLKSLIVCICAGIVLGFFIMLGVWAFSDPKPDAEKCLTILRVASAICALAVSAGKLIYSLLEARPVNKALRIAQQSDDPQRAYDILNKKIERTSDTSKKNAYLLILSALYTENESCDKALEALGEIEFNKLSKELAQEYFNAYMYAYLLKNDIKNAEKVYTDAEPYFTKPAPSVLGTLGVFEYAKGSYGKARSYLLQSKAADDSDRNICSCDLYLALCSLKEGNVEDAKALALEAENTLSTKSNERDLTKLRGLIEKYETIASARTDTADDDEPYEEITDTTDNEERTTTDD